MSIRVAIVEEQGLLRTLLCAVLGGQADFEVVCSHADLTTAQATLGTVTADVVLWGTAPVRWNWAPRGVLRVRRPPPTSYLV